MNNQKRFERLVSQAMGETVPEVDVANSVLEVLSTGRGRSVFVSDRPLMWMAALSSAVAVPVAVLAGIIYSSWTGPLVEIVKSISWATQ